MVTMAEVLAAKEKRQNRQMTMRTAYGLPVVSITINMPGAEKDSPVLRDLLRYAAAAMRDQVNVQAESLEYAKTGPEALLAVMGDAAAIKQAAVQIESRYGFGRLLDIDVFDVEGQLLSRASGSERTCFICRDKAAICRREGRHTATEVQQAVEELLNGFYAWKTKQISPCADKLGQLAVEAMLFEAAATPAPGLVDCANSGAHTDMDLYTFLSSSAALGFSMARMVQAGLQHEGAMQKLLPVLRLIGIEAEQAMLTATNQVNTQKGLVFSLGILLAAAGSLSRNRQMLQATEILRVAAQIVAGIVESDFSAATAKLPEQRTAGERLYCEYGVTGIRGEMEQGLPCVRDQALPALKAALAGGLTINDALIQVLLLLMTCVDDTTVMSRHCPDKLRIWVRERAAAVLAAGGMNTAQGRQAVNAIDQEFIANNVSPGGAADLLAVTWLLYRLEKENNIAR